MKEVRTLRWRGAAAMLIALVLVTLSAAVSFHSHAGSPGDACLVCKTHSSPKIATSAIVVAGPPHQPGITVAATAAGSLRSLLLVIAEGRAPPAAI